MQSSLTINGICGWAIPSRWFQAQIASAFPGSRVQAFYPQFPDSKDEARQIISDHPAELWVGYSLGSLWLLRNAHLLPSSSQIALLCPILGFTREMGRGGKTRTVQLNYLTRSLERQPDNFNLVIDFLEEVGIETQSAEFEFDISPDTLVRGLNFLRDHSFDSKILNPRLSFIGEQDPLIDCHDLKEEIPSLKIIPDTGHHPAPLLEALAKSFIR